MNKITIIGILLTLLGIGMLLFGMSMFTHIGTLNPIIGRLGMYSLTLWLPVLGIGIGVTIFGILKKIILDKTPRS